MRAEVVQLNNRYRESYQEAQDLRFGLGRNRFSGRVQVRGVGSSWFIGTCTPFVTIYV